MADADASVGAHAGNYEREDKVGLSGYVMALLHFGRGLEPFLCRLDRFRRFADQLDLADDGQRQADSFWRDVGIIGSNDAFGLHAPLHRRG